MTRTRPVLAGLLAFLASTAVASAQVPRPTAPAPQPAAPAAPAAPAEPLPSTTFPTPSPSHFTIAREAAILTGLTRSFDAIVPQFAEQARTSTRNRPEIQKDLNEVLKSLEPELELQRQLIVNTAAKLIAGRISEADLKEVLTFFRSPLGQRWMTAQPLIFDDMLKEADAWTSDVTEYVNIRLRAEMAKRGHVLDGR